MYQWGKKVFFSKIIAYVLNALSQTHSGFIIPSNLETCCANQLTGFYMKATLALTGLKIKTPEWPYCHCSGVFIVNFEHI